MTSSNPTADYARGQWDAYDKVLNAINSSEAMDRSSLYKMVMDLRPEVEHKLYTIAVYDNDYHCLAHHEHKRFPTLEAAEQYCRDESWTGEKYILLR